MNFAVRSTYAAILVHVCGTPFKAITSYSPVADTKEKPYACHCGRAFSRRDLLTRHDRLTHRHMPCSSGSLPGLPSGISSVTEEQQLSSTHYDGSNVDGRRASVGQRPSTCTTEGMSALNMDTFFDFTGFVNDVGWVDVDLFELPRGNLYNTRQSLEPQKNQDELQIPSVADGNDDYQITK